MRSILSVVSTAAVLAIAAIAFAAPPQQGSAQLESLSASGVSGEARLKEFQATETQIQAQISGLQPGIEYSLMFSGAQSGTVETFTANPSGRANVNARVAVPIEQISTLSVVRTSDNTTVASGPVVIE
jgi:hypothetical protein